MYKFRSLHTSSNSQVNSKTLVAWSEVGNMYWSLYQDFCKLFIITLGLSCTSDQYCI
jgi:hypothetical protein